MNLREGTRRLALLLGAVGAILGAFASYVELQTSLAQRMRHIEFERLAASDVVQQERKCRLAGIVSGCTDLPAEWSVKPLFDPRTGERIQPKYSDLPNGAKVVSVPPQIDPKTGERIDLSARSTTKQPGQVDYDALAKKYGGTKIHGPWENYAPKDKWDEAAEEFRKGHSELNKGGIKTVTWDVNHNWNDGSGIYSIETQDGQTLYPTPAPAWWSYALLVIIPVIGFIVPWGVIRAIGWVGAGFVHPPK